MRRADLHLSWRTGQWLALASILLAAGLLAWMAIGQARIEIRDAILERARTETPWAVAFLEQAPPGWVPMPWRGSEGDLREFIVDAASRNAAMLKGLKIRRVTEPDGFADAATRWQQQVELCRSASSGEVHLGRACGNVRNSLLPADWRAHFKRTFGRGHYLTRDEDGRIRAGRRMQVGAWLCNAAPYAVKVAGMVDVASQGAIQAQAELLGMRLGPFALSRPSVVAPGACEKRVVQGYDGSGDTHFASDAVDPELVAWFHAYLRQQHPERGTAHSAAPAGLALRCSAPSSPAARILADAFCTPGRGAVTFSPAYNEGRSSAIGRHLISDPLYYSVPPHRMPNGTVRPAFERMRPVLAHMSDLGEVVARQFALEAAWRNSVSRFTLGGALYDDNSVLAEGVRISGLPRYSVWGEPVALPAGGEIVQINERPIFSIWDVNEELAAHATSLRFGAHVPITLVYRIRGPKGVHYLKGEVRLLFDTSVPQAFDTTVPAWWLGLKSGFFARWYVGACFVTENVKAILNVFGADLRVLPINHCAWLVHQQIAFVMQISPREFNFFEDAGKFVAVALITRVAIPLAFEGRLALTRANQSFGYLRSAALLRSTLVDKTVDFAWTVGMQPPSTPIENRLYAALPKDGMSFVQDAVEIAVGQAVQ